MFKTILLCIVLISFSKGDNSTLQLNHVVTKHINDKGEIKGMTVKRDIDPICKNIHISNEVIWQGNYASPKVPEACKSTFVTCAGQSIFPMQLHQKIETYGEVEVMEFIKQMQEHESMLLIDTRAGKWYTYRTIPGAINIYYKYIMKPHIFQDDYEASLDRLGVIGKKKPFDFSKAKTILLFCNGAWCSQSPKMVKSLLALGYPPEKIKWYRGGMEDWLGLSMSTTNKYKARH
jgi:rhodanese-related sulfurtransferase